MLQQDEPDDYVMATGVTTAVRDFVLAAFERAGIALHFEGEGIAEKGIETATGRVLVEVDPRYFRPTEVELLIGDASKARDKLGWEPRVKLPELIEMMVEADLAEAARERHLLDGGFKVRNSDE